MKEYIKNLRVYLQTVKEMQSKSYKDAHWTIRLLVRTRRQEFKNKLLFKKKAN